jgi:crotonobetainyl-CoA:carnitine CoA-transferase CaiB-like acyl-CoA transferase
MLQGITVVEITSSLAGPFTARILSDMGADVFKIESPSGGDAARKWGPPFWRGDATPFHAFNRGKRSVAVDLKDASQRAELQRFIVEHADVVVQNLRAGLVDEYGLDGPTLLKAAPRLVYCNVGGFGPKGPMRSQLGYEALIQGLTGLISMTGEPDRAPVRIGASIVDMGTAMWAAIGILAALNRRNMTGEGRIVDACLYDTGLAWTSLSMAGYQATGKVPTRQGLRGTAVIPNGAFPASDGLLMLVVGTDVQFKALAKALGRPELGHDERFTTNAARRAHENELMDILNAVFLTKNRAEWCAALTAAGVAAVPLQDLGEAAASEQTEASEMLQDCPGDTLRVLGLPLRFDGERPRPERGIPPLGELKLTDLPAMYEAKCNAK